MKRKIVFLWGPIITLALVAGGLGLLRVYLADAAALLASDLTGAGAEIQGVDVAYFPPAVTLRGLRFDTGTERVEVPRVVLYPDLSKIFDGEVTLDRAILDEPTVRAALSGPGSKKDGTPFAPSVLPRFLSIRHASLVLEDKGVPSSPVTFSADLERGAAGIAFQVKSASIPEFGLTFGGTVDVVSMEPLKLDVQGQHGAFNPAALFDFLRRFEYLDKDSLAMLSGTKNIAAEKFSLSFDAKTRQMAFAAAKFVLDATTLDAFATSVDAAGGWSIACKSGSLDAAQMLAVIRAHPDGGKGLADALKSMGLKALAAEGIVSLKDVSVQSRGGAAKPSGTITLATPTLKVSLVSVKDEAQDLTLNNFDGVVTIRSGKPVVSVRSLDLASSSGGDGKVTGDIPVPFALAGTRFQAEARQLRWFQTAFDGTVSKTDERQIDFDLAVTGPDASIKAKGLARNEFSGSDRWAVVMDDLELTVAGAEDEKSAAAEPFRFDFVRDGWVSGRMVVRRLKYNDLPVMRDMTATVTSVKGRTQIRGKGRLCLMRVDVEAALLPDLVAANVVVRGNAVQLPGVMGCFVDELPVFLRGRLTLQAKMSMQGRNGAELRQSVRGDVVARLRDLNVLRMSNLDNRLGFFLEIVNAVGLDADKGDTLSFTDGIIAARVDGPAVTLKSVRFGGSQVSVTGKGTYGLDSKRLRLDAHVVTPFGVNKDISIDRTLAEEKS